jgi:anti-sigma B factor antagonist
MKDGVQHAGFQIRSASNADPVEAVSGFSVITLRGDSDAFVAPRVRSDLATALGTEAPLVVDLTQATFIDSTIVGVLLEGLADCEKRERQLLLLLPDNAAPEVHRLFEITGLAALLPVVRSWDEATSRVAPPPA